MSTPGNRGDAALAPLRQQASAVQEVLATAFDSPGPLYTPQRREIISSWLYNFARNLGAAVMAAETGADMRGQPIAREQILAGLRRMCADYGRAEGLKRLEDVCGKAVRTQFEQVLRSVQSAAT